MSPTMRAWVHDRRGGARDVLKIREDLPKPTLPKDASNMVIVRIAYSGLNPAIEANLNQFPLPVVGKLSNPDPLVPEIDFSGTVAEAGSLVPDQFRTVGTKVFGSVPLGNNFMKGRGTLGEYVLLSADDLALVRPGVAMSEVAALSAIGQTALKMFKDVQKHVSSMERVIVNGASGGVGSTLVQVCKTKSVQVIGICSGSNADFVKGLGADEVIDYRAHTDLPKYLKERFSSNPVDVFFDTIGKQELYRGSPGYLKKDGIYNNIGGMDGPIKQATDWAVNSLVPCWLGGTPRKYLMFSTPLLGTAAQEIGDMMGQGLIKVHVEQVYEFENAIEAIEKLLSKRVRGKLVVKVNGEP